MEQNKNFNVSKSLRLRVTHIVFLRIDIRVTLLNVFCKLLFSDCLKGDGRSFMMCERTENRGD